MATYEQAIKALRAADAAGNVEDAKRLAQIAAKLKNEKPESFDFSALETIKNVPGSAGRYVMDLITPILSPIETGKNLFDLAYGAAQKLIPETIQQELLAEGVTVEDKTAYPEAVGKFFVDRYGSVDDFKRTVQEDPIGALTDISILLTGGGAAVGKVGKTSKIAQAGKATNTLGKAIDPFSIITNSAKYAVGKAVPKAVPRKLYESATKLRPSIDKKTRTNMVETGLREGLMPTTEGLYRLNDVADALYKKIDSVIDASTASGKTIPKKAIYKNLKALRQELGGPKLNASKDLKTVDKIVKGFDVYMKKLGKDSLTPRELQTFKQDAYKRINFDLQQRKAGFAKNETAGAMAKAAKENIEMLDPSIKPTNRRLGDLLELKPELERAASRIENLNLAGLSSPINISAGSMVGGAPGAIAGTGVSFLEMPRPKAYIGIGLENLRNMQLKDLLNNSTAGTLTRQGMAQAGRASNLRP
jgi:hypothetical protein